MQRLIHMRQTRSKTGGKTGSQTGLFNIIARSWTRGFAGWFWVA